MVHIPPFTSIEAPTIFSVDDICIDLVFLTEPEGIKAKALHRAAKTRTV